MYVLVNRPGQGLPPTERSTGGLGEALETTSKFDPIYVTFMAHCTWASDGGGD
jgi:hypothetical protein